MTIISAVKGKIKILDKNISQENVNIAYPYFRLKNKKYTNLLNEHIFTQIQNVIKKELSETKNTIFLQGRYEITVNTKDILSLLFETYTQDLNSNLCYNSITPLTINIKKGSIYNLSDLFIKEKNYETILSNIILQQIRDSNIPIIEEFANITKNRSFYLTETSLVICYTLYKNSHYSSYCTPYFNIPFYSLKHIINPKGPISKLL